MKLKSLALATAGLTLLASSCQNPGTSDKSNSGDTASTAAAPAVPLSIQPVEGSPEFPGASLGIKDVKAELQGTDSVKITIDYTVKNYELKHQTTDATTKECNNSKDGQHIHFILDNAPYKALYEPSNTFTVPVKSEHYLMSFLSRSYHESLKNPEAGVLYKFSVDEKGKLTKLTVPATPMLFYSRPKGDYLGNDTKNVLLDFYVYNGKLSADGYKVKATVNGQDFTIDNWKPYFIQNAPMGDMAVQLQLLDKSGAAVSGDNTSINRTVKLAESEPMK